MSLSKIVTAVNTRWTPVLMTAVQNNEVCEYVSKLVTGVTTRQCCRWVSSHNTHWYTQHTVGWRLYTTTTHTSVTQCFGRCTRWAPHQWCGVPVTASSATLQHGTVHTNSSLPAPPLPSAPPLQLPSQTEQITSPQEVTVEGDRQPSAVVIETTETLTNTG